MAFGASARVTLSMLAAGVKCVTVCAVTTSLGLFAGHVDQQTVADPPPLPPTRPMVPGAEGAPYGPRQLGPPWYPRSPSRSHLDPRGVGVGSSADLGGQVDQMPGARPGIAQRSAVGFGPSGGVNSGVLADMDSGTQQLPAPVPMPQLDTPTPGIDEALP